MSNPHKNALDIQDGCNSLGIAKQMVRDMETLWKEARENGKGTDYVNQHPVMILYLDKLCDLARYRDWEAKSMMMQFSDAYDFCKDRAETIPS